MFRWKLDYVCEREILLFYGKLTFTRNYTRRNHNFSQHMTLSGFFTLEVC